jgi:hypothetical protein
VARRTTVPLMTRLPGTLHKRLAQEAKKERRSLNAELVHRLEHSFEQEAANETLRRANEERDAVSEMLKKVKEERDTAVGLLAQAQKLMKQISDEVLPPALAAARQAAKEFETGKK